LKKRRVIIIKLIENYKRFAKMGKKRKEPPSTQASESGNNDNDDPLAPAKKMIKTPSKGSSSKRLIVVLENAQLESGKVGKTMELLCADKHGTFLRKNGKDPSVYRPDITHQCLLMLLDSPLNRAGLLQVYIHTAKNVLIEVHPQTRIPRTFDRFCGLMVQLLYKLSIHASDGPQKLLKVIKNPVSDHFPAGCRKLCSSFKAPRCVNAKELVPKPEVDGADTPIVIAVGAMAHGSLNLAYTEEDVAISGYPLSAALTCAKLCSAFEESWDVL